jgi:hypothetical protein
LTAPYFPDPIGDALRRYFQNIQQANAPAASDATAVRSRVPAPIAQPTVAARGASVPSIPVPRGTAQPLNPINRVSPLDLVDLMTGARTAAKAGYNTAAALDQGDTAGAVTQAAMTLPMLLPGGAEERAAAVAMPEKWAVLTAENPLGRAASEYENARAMHQLKDKLRQRGIEYHPTNGGYLDDTSKEYLREKGVFLPNISHEDAVALGKQFKQNSIVTDRGLVDLNDNTLIPTKGVVPATETSPAYTITPNGVGFAHDLDWENKIPLEKPAAPVQAPMLNLTDPWQPISRGVFDRSAPPIQGQIPSDPRLAPPATGKRMTTSPFIDAIMNSRSVRKGLDADVAKGMTMGGPGWYELGPIKADLDARAGTGAMSFSDFNNLGGGASASNSVPNEFAAMSIANYARTHGLTREEAVQHFLDATRSPTKAPLMGMHMDIGNAGIENGTVLPSNPMSDAWKIPSYVDKRNGGGGSLDVTQAGGMPALDTHERRRIMQLAMANQSLAKVARETGADVAAAKAKGAVPLRNVLDYQALSSLYTDGAQRMGLPTAGAYQAPRWVGGWDKTGLKSPPTGDFVQLLEDALKYSAQQRGLDDSPAGLRNYWERVVKGNDFILPFSGKGYYPIK